MSHSSLNRRTFIAGATGAAAAGALVGTGALEAEAATNYTASWSSVDKHTPAPEWFQDAKFGIYYHWGVFSVPAYGNEWYPRRMYISGDSCNSHHKNAYGDPNGNWPYENFINGANNKAGTFTKFAPKLTSAGGQFDPNEWAETFKNAGAKYAGPVAEHHDGFSMWNSKVNEWNSVGKGPKLDLLSLHKNAIRGQGLKLLVAMHHAYHFTGYYDHVPPQSTATLRKLFAQQGNSTEQTLWYNKLVEVIDQAQPDILWQDFNLSRVDESLRLKFLAYYYNQANSWGKEVVATYKDGFDTKGEVLDFERGGPGGLLTPYWLTDDAVSSSSWCYTSGMRYYSQISIVHAMIDRISKGGNLLLNISPEASGFIPQAQRDILTAIGSHLNRSGEAAYTTRPWSVYGEGPTKMGGGSGFSAPKAGTNTDIRYTRTKGGTVIFATVLGWPGNGATLTLGQLGSNHMSLSNLKRLELFGNTAGEYITLSNHHQDSSGFHITMPNKPYTANAYVVKVTFNGPIPSHH